MEFLNFLFNSKKEGAEEEEIPESEFEGDIRAQVWADQFLKAYEREEISENLEGRFQYYYRKCEGALSFLIAILFFCFIFQKPNWCDELGDQMKSDCSEDITGEVQYNLKNNIFIDPKTSFVISFGIMYVLLIVQVLKVHCSKIIKPMEVIKMYLQIFIFAIALVLSLMETFQFIAKSDIKNLLKMAFILLQFNDVLRSLYRMFFMVKNSGSVIFLLVIVLTVFGVISRVLFQGVDIGADADQLIFAYSFTSFWRSFETMFITIIMGNFPDIVIDAYKINAVYALYFMFYILLCANIIFGIFAGALGDNFVGFYGVNLNEISHKHEEFNQLIRPEMDKKTMSSLDVDGYVKNVFLTREKGKMLKKNPDALKTGLEKLRRAVRKIKFFKTLTSANSTNDGLGYYNEIQEKIFYKFITFILCLYITLSPVFIVDRSTINYAVTYYQGSSLLAVLFLVELYIKQKSKSSGKFWDFGHKVELISDIGIFITSNVLFVLPVDYRDQNLVGNRTAYFLWSFFCICKFVRMNKILMGLVEYRILVSICLDVFVLFLDVLKIYFLVVFFYGAIGLLLFGGLINSKAIAEMDNEDHQGVFDGNIFFNFNDIVNSFIFFFNMDLSGGYLGYKDMILLTGQLRGELTTTKILLYKLWAYSYMLVTAFTLLNLLITFIGGFMGFYQAQSEEEKLKQQEIQRNQTLIDFLLDKERKDGDVRSDVDPSYSPNQSIISKNDQDEDGISNDDSLIQEIEEEVNLSLGSKIKEGVDNPNQNKKGTGIAVDIVPKKKDVLQKNDQEEELNDLLKAPKKSEILKKESLNQSASQEEEIDILAQKSNVNEQLEKNPKVNDEDILKGVNPKKKQDVGQKKKVEVSQNTEIVEALKKNEEKEIKKAKLFKRSESFAIKKENGNSCNKDLLLAFGIVLDKDRENIEILPEPSSTKTKTLCRRNIGTCCTYNEMMSVSDNFAIAANKFRQQFEILEELFIMFKGSKINEVLYNLRDNKKCKKLLDEHSLIPKDKEGKYVGNFENYILPKIQERVEGLFNEKRRYKKHIISTYGNLVCSICSPSEQNFFKYHEDTGVTDLEVNFSNCQEILDLKDFEIRVIESYQEFILPLARIFDCEDKEENPKIDALDIDEAIINKELFNDCYQNFAIENPKCLQICKKFDLGSYKFPGNFFKVSKQIVSLFFMKFLAMDAVKFYKIRKEKDFENFAVDQTFNFFPIKHKDAKIDIKKTDIKYVQAKGINITNDYINRIFLEHNQYKFATLEKIIPLLMLILIF